MATSDLSNKLLRSDAECGLLSLPPEIRNNVFEMILMKDQPTRMSCDEKTKKPTDWPDIADTCQQLRAETLPVFFGRNSLVYDALLDEGLDDDSSSALSAWMVKLAQTPPHLVSLLQQVAVNFCDVPMGYQEMLCHYDDDSTHWDEHVFLPHFYNADRLLGTIARSGLAARQLVWPGVDESDSSGHGTPGWSHDGRQVDDGMKICMLKQAINQFVLPLLLRRHGLYDDASPHVDVVAQLRRQYDYEQEFWQDYLDRRQSLWRGRSPPDWYSLWLTEKEGQPRHDSSEQSSLFRLPGDNREQILQLVLNSDEDVSAWSSLFDVCRKLSEEIRLLYFDKAKFFISSRPGFRDDKLVPFMESLKSLGFDTIKLIESVTIELEVYRFVETAKPSNPHVNDHISLSYRPDFDGCEELVIRVRDSSLMAHQVRWPGFHENLFDADSLLGFANPHNDGDADISQWKECVEMDLLNIEILPPLLKRYGMYDRTRPPVDVRMQLAQYQDMELPPISDKQWDVAFDHLKRAELSERFDDWGERQEAEEGDDG